MWILLPVKEIECAKQRLSRHLLPKQRQALSRAMLNDMLEQLCALSDIDGILMVTSDPAASQLQTSIPLVIIPDPGKGGLNGAVQSGIDYLETKGVETVMVIHGDIPLANRQSLEAIVQHHYNKCGGNHVTLVPDEQGDGTNVLLATPVNGITFSYGKDSFNAHQLACNKAGLPISVIEDAMLGLDIDTASDLAKLSEFYQANPQFHSSHTYKALQGFAKSKEGACDETHYPRAMVG